MFVFKCDSLTRELKNALESLSQCAYDDNEQLAEMSSFEIAEWFVDEAKNYAGVALDTVGIETELRITE